MRSVDLNSLVRIESRFFGSDNLTDLKLDCNYVENDLDDFQRSSGHNCPTLWKVSVVVQSFDDCHP